MSPKPSRGTTRTTQYQGNPRRILVGITGGSGVIYGVRLLEVLQQKEKDGIETHLIISPAAAITIKAETDYSSRYVEKLATKVYRFGNIAAPLASGSFRFDSMIIVPTSMHTLGAIASGVSDNLIVRAAEVALKEKHRLILVPRETPLTLIHLQNMVRAAEAGAIILPAMPAFYEKPKSIDDIVDHLVGKILDLLEIENALFKRWEGLSYS
ncbi:MAG: UbiX family flavin prenyltransferase [archaeon]|nr:UbiX family flavin prenyltransferase [archaeon]